MNRNNSVSDLLSFTWSKTKAILFPFAFKRWAVILLIVWLAGHGANGLSGNNSNLSDRLNSNEEQSETVSDTDAAESLNDEDSPSELGGSFSKGRDLGVLGKGIITLGVPFALFLWLLFMWISARFNFVFLDLLIRGDVRIGTSFKDNKALGNSYFIFSILFALIALSTVILLALPSFVLRPLIVLSALGIFILVAALAILGTIVIDFVLPMMYRDKTKCVVALKGFFALKPHIKRIAMYLLVKAGLAFMAGLIGFLATFLVGGAALLVGLVIGLMGDAIGTALPFLGSIFPIIGTILLVLGLLTTVVVIGLVTLPIPIFFRVFALSYLTTICPQYDLLDRGGQESSSLE